jgi:hypothetical protein
MAPKPQTTAAQSEKPQQKPNAIVAEKGHSAADMQHAKIPSPATKTTTLNGEITQSVQNRTESSSKKVQKPNALEKPVSSDAHLHPPATAIAALPTVGVATKGPAHTGQKPTAQKTAVHPVQPLTVPTTEQVAKTPPESNATEAAQDKASQQQISESMEAGEQAFSKGNLMVAANFYEKAVNAATVVYHGENPAMLPALARLVTCLRLSDQLGPIFKYLNEAIRIFNRDQNTAISTVGKTIFPSGTWRGLAAASHRASREVTGPDRKRYYLRRSARFYELAIENWTGGKGRPYRVMMGWYCTILRHLGDNAKADALERTESPIYLETPRRNRADSNLAPGSQSPEEKNPDSTANDQN